MFPQCSHSSFSKSLLFDFFSSSSLYLIIIDNNVELFFAKIMYLYILISKKNIAVSSTIFVGRGRFALPKPHKWHSTYRRADLSTSKYFYFVLLSYLPKELWEKDSNLRPQGNEPCELPLLPSHDIL